MNPKKIALFGTNRQVVRQVAEEALKRGNNVTVVLCNPGELKLRHPKLKVISGDLMNQKDVSKYSKGHDVVICLHELELSRPERHIRANCAIIEGSKKAGIQHIISLGHPILLKLNGSTDFFDLCDLWKPIAEAQLETLQLFKNEAGLRWGYIHSVELKPSLKTGKYTITDEVILTNPEGKSKINVHKLIDVLLNEAEKTEYVWETNEINL